MLARNSLWLFAFEAGVDALRHALHVVGEEKIPGRGRRKFARSWIAATSRFRPGAGAAGASRASTQVRLDGTPRPNTGGPVSEQRTGFGTAGTVRITGNLFSCQKTCLRDD